jgi:hypothetical protein
VIYYETRTDPWATTQVEHASHLGNAGILPGPGDGWWDNLAKPSDPAQTAQWAARCTFIDYHTVVPFTVAAQFAKVRLTGPCHGTLLQFANIRYYYSVTTGLFGLFMSLRSDGALNTDDGYVPPFSMEEYTLARGETLEFSATAGPYTEGDGDPFMGNQFKAQAAFVFNKRPSDFRLLAGIVAIAPSSLGHAYNYTLVVTGAGLAAGFTLTIGGVNVTGISTLISSTEIDVAWVGNTLTAGYYDVVYTPATGSATTLIGAFQVY